MNTRLTLLGALTSALLLVGCGSSLKQQCDNRFLFVRWDCHDAPREVAADALATAVQQLGFWPTESPGEHAGVVRRRLADVDLDALGQRLQEQRLSTGHRQVGRDGLRAGLGADRSAAEEREHPVDDAELAHGSSSTAGLSVTRSRGSINRT